MLIIYSFAITQFRRLHPHKEWHRWCVTPRAAVCPPLIQWDVEGVCLWAKLQTAKLKLCHNIYLCLLYSVLRLQYWDGRSRFIKSGVLMVSECRRGPQFAYPWYHGILKACVCDGSLIVCGRSRLQMGAVSGAPEDAGILPVISPRLYDSVAHYEVKLS